MLAVQHDKPNNIYTRQGKFAEIDCMTVRAVNAYPWECIDLEHAHTIIDIGAGIGEWTRYVTQHTNKARIAAVEMDAENMLLLNINTWGNRHITRLNASLAYTQDRCILASHTYDPRLHRLVNHKASQYIPWTYHLKPAPERLTVESVMGKIGAPEIDILKINAPGSEYDILWNMPAETLVRCKTIVGVYELDNPDMIRVFERLDQAHFQAVYSDNFLEAQTLALFVYRRCK